MIVVALLALVWAALTLLWADPFTSLYTYWQQHRLEGQYQKQGRLSVTPTGSDRRALLRALAQEAARYRRQAKTGQAIGRITIPSIHASYMLVNGTDESSLQKGPGRDLRSAMPGQGQLVYIAGHRTTYLAPFSHIDQIKKGDLVMIAVPYATFYYRVSGSRVVAATDLKVLRSPGYESLRLQACHPRFFATHRYIVYALPVRAVVNLRGG